MNDVFLVTVALVSGVIVTALILMKRSSRLEKIEQHLHDSIQKEAQTSREENAKGLAMFQQTQSQQLSDFSRQLLQVQQSVSQSLQQIAKDTNDTWQRLSNEQENRLAEFKKTLDTKLTELQKSNEERLEKIRLTVDEKLHSTLERRLSESFKQVALQLESVQRGLGEMRSLSQGMNDLKRVLGNIKTRGVFGETQLAALLEQLFTVNQYGTNVEVVPHSGQRVEFALRLPGKSDPEKPMWLPIDAKFPREDYERLIDAEEHADTNAAKEARKALDSRIRREAKAIHDRYLDPAHTTDIAILFLPVEGLYAEVLRRPGLLEQVHREYHVIIAGPTTLAAILSSFQLLLGKIVLEKRASEVWQLLGTVKTEFAKFAEMLAKTKKKLEEAGNAISEAERRTRVMGRDLRDLETLPTTKPASALPALHEVE